jgi:hypothetical protein
VDHQLPSNSKKPSKAKRNRRTDSKHAISTADNYYGAFKVNQWPEDIDNFIAEAMQTWHSHQKQTALTPTP